MYYLGLIMDVGVAARLLRESSDARLYKTKIVNAEGELASPGDLLFEGIDFGVCVKGWLGIVNQDIQRKFNVCSSHAPTLDGNESESQELHDRHENNIGNVTYSCRGNGRLMRSGKAKKVATEEFGSDELSKNACELYEFNGVQSIHLLNMKQIQQLRVIGRDNTAIWHWAHHQRFSASKIQYIRNVGRSILSKSNLTLDSIILFGAK